MVQKAKDRLAFLESLDEAGREAEMAKLLKENDDE
jgi:hypothetical protein